MSTEPNIPSVPLFDSLAEDDGQAAAIEAAVLRVIRSGRYILGPEVEAFEQEVAEYLGTKHAIGVNSGTDALVISLRALGIGPGDEVITTPFTFFATAEAIANVGARPVFVDIEPDSFNLDPSAVAAAVGDRTRAIMPVHLFGHSADMQAICKIARTHGLDIIEDVAQAMGGRHEDRMLGSLGDAGAFSFFPSKNLGACGDGGMVVTDREDIAETARSLRHHGALGGDKRVSDRLGFNSRLDAVQAAILRARLPGLDPSNEGRRRAARRYCEAFESTPGVQVPSERAYAHHVYHQFTIRCPPGSRDMVVAHLADRGIATGVYYARPLHLLPMFKGPSEARLPQTDRAANEVVSLPIWSNIGEETITRVAKAVSRIVKGKGADQTPPAGAEATS